MRTEAQHLLYSQVELHIREAETESHRDRMHVIPCRYKLPLRPQCKRSRGRLRSLQAQFTNASPFVCKLIVISAMPMAGYESAGCSQILFKQNRERSYHLRNNYK